ncbi:MAG TPA: SDR family oxidoreductase [Thermoanaerobaculia bacterium]|jgi:NAD(P)-dependent dehydrogenase (short-subunit alcohol dehydrogenase family)|nr:SDR family oxidoreductase [Thermoanaerobaculia bacterium]
MDTFRDSIAIVTGGASGIGQALCEELARRGAVVVVTDVDEAGARSVAEGIASEGGRASSRALDVRDPEAVKRVVEETAAAHGRLDYMFNNAGLAVTGEIRDLSLEHWHKVVDVNLWGVIHGIAAAYPLMVRQRSGHIVNTASLAGLLGIPCSSPYATTKFAVVGLSQSLRTEAEGLGVKVSVVCPSYIQTRIFEASTYVRSSKEDVLSLLTFKMMEVGEAVRQILHGVERNRALIVLPFYARVLWWLSRLFPGMPLWLNGQAVRKFRKLRPAEDAAASRERPA